MKKPHLFLSIMAIMSILTALVISNCSANLDDIESVFRTALLETPSSSSGEPQTSSPSGSSSSAGSSTGSSSSIALSSSSTALSSSSINPNTFTDSRDGNIYGWVEIGLQKWMAENLNFNKIGSMCYGDNTGNDSQNNCAKYGRLYNWETAIEVCPLGWHLPSNAEWDELISYIEGDKGCAGCAGKHLKSASGWSSGNGQNSYGFSALPGGGGYFNGNFDNISSGGRWWGSSEDNISNAYRWLMGSNYDYVDINTYDKRAYFSVRCVED